MLAKPRLLSLPVKKPLSGRLRWRFFDRCQRRRGMVVSVFFLFSARVNISAATCCWSYNMTQNVSPSVANHRLSSKFFLHACRVLTSGYFVRAGHSMEIPQDCFVGRTWWRTMPWPVHVQRHSNGHRQGEPMASMGMTHLLLQTTKHHG